jgi:hypothetical protein
MKKYRNANDTQFLGHIPTIGFAQVTRTEAAKVGYRQEIDCVLMGSVPVASNDLQTKNDRPKRLPVGHYDSMQRGSIGF